MKHHPMIHSQLADSCDIHTHAGMLLHATHTHTHICGEEQGVCSRDQGPKLNMSQEYDIFTCHQDPLSLRRGF